MKKLIIIFLVFFISCGPSEEEVRSLIDEAVEQATSTTTTSSTTTTTIKRVEWTPSEIELACPTSRDLMYDSVFKAGFNVKFGSNPTQLTLNFYNFEDEEEQSLEWTKEKGNQITWEEGSGTSLSIYDIKSLSRDYEFFYFTVEVKDSSGVVTKECNIKNTVDIDALPPIVEVEFCPKTAGQDDEVEVKLAITSRTEDVEYIQWEFQDDTRIINFSDLIDTENLPEKGKEYDIAGNMLSYYTGTFNAAGNLIIIANVYDSLGRSSRAVCGVVLEP